MMLLALLSSMTRCARRACDIRITVRPPYKMTLQVDWVRRVGKGPPRRTRHRHSARNDETLALALPTLRS